jgi:cytochrome c oxidase subunit II
MRRTTIPTRSSLKRTLAATLLATLLSLGIPSTALADVATPEEPVSPNAKAMDDVYFAILGVTITVFVLVGGWLLYSAIRFRARPGDPIEPPQIHGSTRLEIGWTIVPILILVGLAGYTLAKLPDVQDAPKGAREVKVVGFQFGWEFKGVGNFKLPKNMPANTLIIPVNTPVKLSMTSRDVIHDWWVPELGQKKDMWPGATTDTWIDARKTGTYDGQCSEFCGTGHADMSITVKVVSKEQFSKLGGQGA